ncbi:hypothetical protein TSOC_001840 [Tetrabaena socialis]|uniref:Uncharacterized protein n=1 Tax=Tetrabaena socialis TaxID=47790 RepID=A0A2J8AFL2_9CHLO|nr:hypothetical protein TSOC_001840 [Tetrabaena socialis]|eukprot:PNH11310.1 hypothetical protein TSOC_001840 [Tetrabaena socialis]
MAMSRGCCLLTGGGSMQRSRPSGSSSSSSHGSRGSSSRSRGGRNSGRRPRPRQPHHPRRQRQRTAAAAALKAMGRCCCCAAARATRSQQMTRPRRQLSRLLRLPWLRRVARSRPLLGWPGRKLWARERNGCWQRSLVHSRRATPSSPCRPSSTQLRSAPGPRWSLRCCGRPSYRHRRSSRGRRMGSSRGRGRGRGSSRGRGRRRRRRRRSSRGSRPSSVRVRRWTAAWWLGWSVSLRWRVCGARRRRSLGCGATAQLRPQPRPRCMSRRRHRPHHQATTCRTSVQAAVWQARQPHSGRVAQARRRSSNKTRRLTWCASRTSSLALRC